MRIDVKHMTVYPDEIVSNISNAKQAALLKAAYQLFRKHGFQRVSIEEICRTAGVSKVTFYKYYAGKDELIIAMVKSIIERHISISDTIMQSGKSIKDKLEQIISSKRNLISNLGEEMVHSILLTPITANYLSEIRGAALQSVRSFFTREQQQGNINPKVNVDFILLFMEEINKMVDNEAMLNKFGSVEQMVAQINEILMFGIVARDKQ